MTESNSIQGMLTRLHEVDETPLPGRPERTDLMESADESALNETAGLGFDGEIEIQAAPPNEEERAIFAFRRSDNSGSGCSGFSYQVTPSGRDPDAVGGAFTGTVHGVVVSTAREAFRVCERMDSRFADWWIASQPMSEGSDPEALTEAQDPAKMKQARLALLDNPNKRICKVLDKVKHFSDVTASRANFAVENKRVERYRSSVEESRTDYLELGDDLAHYCHEFLRIWEGKSA